MPTPDIMYSYETEHFSNQDSLNNIEIIFNLDDARLIDVSWKANDKALSQARLYIETIDKPGMLAKLSASISSLNINLAHLAAYSTQDRHAHFTFVLQVKDKPQLLNLNRKLMSSEGVLSVRR